jgi:hypothetical protein
MKNEKTTQKKKAPQKKEVIKRPRAAEKTDTNKKKFLECLESCLGVVSVACKKSKVGRSTVYEWFDEDKNFEKEFKYIRDELSVDFAESSLYQQIESNNTTATIFYLKTRGRHRGYTEVIEQKIETTDMHQVDYSKLSAKELKDLKKLQEKASGNG